MANWKLSASGDMECDKCGYFKPDDGEPIPKVCPKCGEKMEKIIILVDEDADGD